MSLDKLVEKKNELRTELLEKVGAIESSDWEIKAGHYADCSNYSLTFDVDAVHAGKCIDYTANLGPYTIQLRQIDTRQVNLSLFEPHEEQPILCFEGEDVVSLYLRKSHEVSEYQHALPKPTEKEELLGERNSLQSVLDGINSTKR